LYLLNTRFTCFNAPLGFSLAIQIFTDTFFQVGPNNVFQYLARKRSLAFELMAMKAHDFERALEKASGNLLFK